MSRLELARPRDISTLFGDALGVYFRNAGTFLALSAAVVVPVHLIVEGVGMEQLTAGFDDSPSAAEAIIPTLVSFLVVAPLINAICIHALHAVGGGERPRARRALSAGLEDFAPIFFAVVLAGIGIALGLVLLVLPGIYVAVRWYFVPQTVVVEGARGTAALDRSGELVRGHVVADLRADPAGQPGRLPAGRAADHAVRRRSPTATTAPSGRWSGRWPPRRSRRRSSRSSRRSSTTTSSARRRDALVPGETAV